MPTPPIALITGAASGLGRALALRYAQAGWQVCAADIQAAGCAETVALITQTGQHAWPVTLDVTRSDDWQTVAADFAAQGTLPDVLINNAGVASGGPFDWLSQADWDWVMGINFNGVLKGCQTFVPGMKQRGHGHIVNIASMAGLLNPPGMSNYNVSKAAVISLSETLRMELQPYGIVVSCVCPSFFRTNLGDSLRSPDASTALSLQKLMESSTDLSAQEIAACIFAAQQRHDYLVLPHARAAQAWHFHNQDLDAYLASNYPLAEHVKQRAKPLND
jgi:NAD(P)-dependent dehydrogenase (short-subunit alcohol dehydrogenase family)